MAAAALAALPLARLLAQTPSPAPEVTAPVGTPEDKKDKKQPPK